MIVQIVSWNVNGLRSIEKKKALLWIDSSKPDILCLQETKLSSKEYTLKLFNKQYSSITLNNSINKGFSGTLTYSNLKITEEYLCPQVDKDNDGRIIEQHYNNLIIFNVYFPNGKLNETKLDKKIKFYENFLMYCEKLKKENKFIIICGDFNTAHKDIDLKKTKIHSKSGFSDKERDYFDKFIQKGYIDTYRYIHGNKKEAYSWWSYRSNGRLKNEGWRIDYILISSNLKSKLKDAYVLDQIEGSDHCPVGIRINLSDYI